MRKTYSTTPYRKELKNKLLEAAIKEFFRKGIRGVKMDYIASLLSISKRTLYEMYPNKEELLIEGLRHYDAKRHEHMQELSSMPEVTVMDTLLEFYQMKLQCHSEISPKFVEDLEHYEKVNDFFAQKRNNQEKKAQLLISKGIEEGYFLPSIDITLVTHGISSAIRGIVRTPYGASENIKNIFPNVVCITLRGLCTQKGITFLDSKLQL